MATSSASPITPDPRESPLGWLGHRIAHHPAYSLVAWVAIVLVCLLPASQVGSVISNGFGNPLPAGDQSVLAGNEYAADFPKQQSSPSSAIIVLEGSNITGAAGKGATLAITARLMDDRALHNVSSVESLYDAYTGYLAGQVELGWSFLGAALAENPSLPVQVNSTAHELWAPIAAYVANWSAIAANLSEGAPASGADGPALQQTAAGLSSDPTEHEVLNDFYNGTGGASVGFNASVAAGCLASANVSTCATRAAQSSLPGVLAAIVSPVSRVPLASAVLGDLTPANYSSADAQRLAGLDAFGPEVGLSPGWLLTIWNAFPSSAPPSGAQADAWAATQVASDPVGALPLPIPSTLYGSFVDPADSATLLIVSFNVGDSYTVNGSSVTFGDVSEIDHDVAQVLASTPAYAGLQAQETGAAPLDDATSYLATSALSLLLVLTIIVLLVIMLLYFRAPAAPALAFGMIGIALVACFAGIFVVGTFVTKFNAEIESIILVFLMSIGTDYSVFLLARYREELVRGTAPREAVATTVRWAGQSISTSGLAVIVVAIALTLSGISFLSQLGICLLLAVAFALLVNLTVLPSILVLVGPRIFWPNSGRRFAAYADRRRENVATNRDTIARAGRAATRRPVLVIGLILVLSAPVMYVALQVPVSYDITNIGLPAGNSAEVGFVHLQRDFGSSYSSTSYALVTFRDPIDAGGTLDAAELRDVAALSETMAATPGIASATSFVGPGGAPLSNWLNFSSLPPATRVGLNESLASAVGVDGRTVLFTIATNGSGYSAAAIGVIDALEDRVDSYRTAHPEVEKVLVGGAAPTTQDIRSLVNQATEEMLVGAAIGLFVLMVLILGSAFVPLLALGVIGLSILWSWAATYFVVGLVENEALIFLLPLILLILVLGLGMDYNVLLLTRVKEERTLGNRGVEAIRDAVTHAGGVITAAAVILGGAFLLLGFTSPLGLIAAIGLGIGFAVLLQAFVVQLFFTPAVLTLGKDWIWKGGRRSKERDASP